MNTIKLCNYLWIILIIGSAAGTIIEGPEDTEAESGSTVKLRCQRDLADDSNPVEWHFQSDVNNPSFVIVYKLGMILNGNQGKMVVERNSSTGTFDLVIFKVSRSNAGIYTCMDDDSQHTAELIVLDRYPSGEFCSLTKPSDFVLGRNNCSLDSDWIQISCQLRYKGNSDLYFEWKNGERLMDSNDSRTNDGTMTSMIRLKADEIQSSHFSCRLKYRDDRISSKFEWTTSVNVSTVVASTKVIEGTCDLPGMKCSGLGPVDGQCNFTWIDHRRSVIAMESYLSLADKPSGSYTCIATCNIRLTSCSLEAQTVVYTCDKTSVFEPVAFKQPLLLVIIGVIVLTTVTAITIVIVLAKRWFHKHRASVDLETMKPLQSSSVDLP